MPTTKRPGPPQYLTTREVAELLRVRERKVYDLAGAGEIPHRRITGKLLFPAGEIFAWIEGSGPSRPPVIAGCSDLLLDWAVRSSGCGLATRFDGSADGLTLFANGGAALIGLHIAETDDWNLETVASLGLSRCVLITWAERVQGLIVRPDLQAGIQGLADLAGLRVKLRKPGSGAGALFDKLAARIDRSTMVCLSETAPTGTEAAMAVVSGEADATIGTQALARQFRLGFVPLTVERFDLLIDRRSYFSQPLQDLMNFARGPDLAAKAAAFGGYDLTRFGDVRWVSF